MNFPQANLTTYLGNKKNQKKQYHISGWDGLLNEVETFCQANKISIVNMEDIKTSSNEEG